MRVLDLAEAAPVVSDRHGPRIGVLALQGDVAEHARALALTGAQPSEVRNPADLDGLDGLILPGGESTAISMLLESSKLFDPLEECLHGGLPVLGTCAGMILLARTVLDGRPDQRVFSVIDLTVRRNAFGRQAQSFECDLDLRGHEADLGAGPLPAVFIRAPQIEAMGCDVEGLAWLPSGGNGQPVLCRQGSVVVASFHPELTSDGRVHEYFCQSVVRKEP